MSHSGQSGRRNERRDRESREEERESRDAKESQVTEAPREPKESRETRERTPLAGWFTETVLRAGVAIIGIVLLVFALGQAVGMDLLGAIGAALSSQTGRWLAVAFFALVLIGVAQRGISHRYH